MRQLLAAIDFSQVSQAVIEHAALLAGALAADLTLVHIAAPDPEFVGFAVGPQSVRDGRAGEIRTEHRELQEAAKALCERAISARALLIQGPTAETILAEAQRLEADMIVIGSHGHGMLYRALLGSVSEGVVRGARCPVLIVPAARPPSP